MSIDPITVQVLLHAFYSISDEMNAALVRTSYSTNIKDRRDCSTAIFTPGGELIAQSAFGTPLHLGVLPFTVRTLLAEIPVDRMEPGADYIVNLPYPAGPGHLNDVTIVTPVYWRGDLVAVLAAAAHHVDVGGGAPGSMPFGVTEIFQEGLQIPPLRISTDGELHADIMALILQNVRTTVEFKGDLLAQIAANNVGEERLGELLDRHGRAALDEYVPALLDYSEARMRAALRGLPDGAWAFEDVIEGDGVDERDITIRARVTLEGDELEVDFSDTDDQVRGPLNCRPPSVIACVLYAVLCVTDPELRPNDGLLRPLRTVTRPGSLLHAEYPAAVCNANIVTTQRVVDVVLGALAQAAPERVCAACSGTMNLFNIGGRDPSTGALFNYVETYGGGQGGLPDRDGASGMHTHMTNTRNASVEQIELAYPLSVIRYGLVEDSDGPGRWRGGMGIERQLRVLGEHVTLTLSSDRHRHGPWGLQGGGDGRSGECLLIDPGGQVERLPSKVTRTIETGSTIVSRTPGGGGHGDPFRRGAERVLADVRNEFVSRERAQTMYGVVPTADGEAVDVEATRLARLEAMASEATTPAHAG